MTGDRIKSTANSRSMIGTKRMAVIMAVFAAMIFFLAGCGGSTEPAEKVYVEESEIEAALSNGDAYKGQYIALAGKVFNVDMDGDSVVLQVWHDVENSDQQFVVYADKETAGSVKADDFVKADGKIAGTFKYENLFGGEMAAPLIEADTVETGGYDEIYAPAESTKEIGQTEDQHGLSITLDRAEYAKGEARIYLTVKNESGDTASVYTFDAKAVQEGKQFDHESNYQAGSDDDIDEVLDGASKEGVLRFKGLDPEKGFTLTLEAYSDNYDIELEDYVFEVE